MVSEPFDDEKQKPLGKNPAVRRSPSGKEIPARNPMERKAGERPGNSSPRNSGRAVPPERKPVRKAPVSHEGTVRQPAHGEKRPVRNPGNENRPPVKRSPRQAPSSHPAARSKNAEAQGKRISSSKGRTAPRPGYQPRFASGKKKKTSALDPKMLALIALLCVGSLILVIASIHVVTGPNKPGKTTDLPSIPQLETLAPVIPTVVSEAKITVTGDLLPHKTIYSKGSAVYKDSQSYDFYPVFKYLKGYTDQADFAVANLETSLYGPKKPYSGNPKFNTPDQLVDGAKNAGFDLLLTANNHCNDTGIEGVLRTVEVIRQKGLTALGTNLDSTEEKYVIQDIGGIRIGMLCYTYEDSQDPNQVTFNYNPLPKDQSDLVCSFPKFTNMKSREPFYEAISSQMAEMRQKGAQAIVLFLHWGDEYYLQPNADQRDMAQQLCDLGVDVIVGGHPHVVEPVELLTSREDESKKTVCLYSLGNAFSNQRREEMKSITSGHTEDGMLFNMTFRKYSDGSVYLSQVDVIPTWVNKFQNAEELREYNILPLNQDTRAQWQSLYALDEPAYLNAQESYGRTMELVGAGLEQSNQWLQGRLPGAESEVPLNSES